MASTAALIAELLGAIGNDNAKGEFYLTDIVGIARGRRACRAHRGRRRGAEFMGVNTRAELAAAEARDAAAACARQAMAGGVTLTRPDDRVPVAPTPSSAAMSRSSPMSSSAPA